VQCYELRQLSTVAAAAATWPPIRLQRGWPSPAARLPPVRDTVVERWRWKRATCVWYSSRRSTCSSCSSERPSSRRSRDRSRWRGCGCCSPPDRSSCRADTTASAVNFTLSIICYHMAHCFDWLLHLCNSVHGPGCTLSYRCYSGNSGFSSYSKTAKIRTSVRHTKVWIVNRRQFLNADLGVIYSSSFN